jgi:hypothetical protein
MLVELANHRVGQRLSQLFLVGVLDHPVTALRRSERVGHVGHERVGAPVHHEPGIEHHPQLGFVQG